jgi:hypothetical protein
VSIYDAEMRVLTTDLSPLFRQDIVGLTDGGDILGGGGARAPLPTPSHGHVNAQIVAHKI